MKVLSLLSSADVGGAEVHVEQILRHMPARHAVVALADGPMIERYAAAGAEVELLPAPGKIPLRAAPGLERILARFDPDVLHSHQTKATLLAALARTRRKRIITIHGSHRQFAMASSVPAAWYKWADMWSAKGASRVIAVCEADRRELVAVGFAAEKTVTVPNGVPDPGIDQPGRAGEILWAGRLSREKAPETALDVARILAAHPKLERFRMIGDGPLRPVVAAASIPKFTLEPPAPSLRDAFASTSIVLNTSHSEGASLVLVEALASGRAIVASGVGGNPEVVGSAGLIVPAELSGPDRVALFVSSVKRLLESPDFLEETSRRARERYLERFRIEVMIDRLMKVYRQEG